MKGIGENMRDLGMGGRGEEDNIKMFHRKRLKVWTFVNMVKSLKVL